MGRGVLLSRIGLPLRPSQQVLCLHENHAAQPTNLSCIKKEKNIYDIHNSPGPSVGPCGSHILTSGPISQNPWQPLFITLDTLIVYLDIYISVILGGGNLNVDFFLRVFGGETCPWCSMPS